MLDHRDKKGETEKMRKDIGESLTRSNTHIPGVPERGKQVN
jgi:hypothetical protein